jgi:hypothetical protein
MIKKLAFAGRMLRSPGLRGLVCEDHKSKVPFKPSLNGFWGPPKTPIEILEVRGCFFFTFKGSGTKKVENHCIRRTGCFIDLGKLNLLKISLPWSKSVKQTVEGHIGVRRTVVGAGQDKVLECAKDFYSVSWI